MVLNDTASPFEEQATVENIINRGGELLLFVVWVFVCCLGCLLFTFLLFVVSMFFVCCLSFEFFHLFAVCDGLWWSVVLC